MGVLVIVKTANWWRKNLNPPSETIAPPMSFMLLGTHERGEVDIGAPPSGNRLPLLEVIDDIIIGWSHADGFTHRLLEQQLDMVDVTEQPPVVLPRTHFCAFDADTEQKAQGLTISKLLIN